MSKDLPSRRGTRIYRGAGPRPLPPGACPHCSRVVGTNQYGIRRHHRDAAGRDCVGSGIAVRGAGTPVQIGAVPPVRTRPVRKGDECVCGWRPRVKADGTFAAHRVEPDNPVAPYCPNGSPRSY